MTDGKIDAQLALRSDGRLLVGRDRITLLEAVAEHGSITKAAEAVGFSYKTAWDAVAAINNLLPTPAFVTKTGGRKGGGAEVTEEGRRLIVAFRRLEEMLGRISAAIAEEGLQNIDDLLLWGMTMKLSARNAIRCEVSEVRSGPVSVVVKLRVPPDTTITAVVTNGAAAELGLVPGRQAVALVKSSSVMLAPVDEVPRLSVRNRIIGTVARRIDSEVGSEIAIDIGGGKTLLSVVTREGADELGAEVGSQVCALFKATHVILAAG
ncbi:TOBE domain-containing protein [Blastochloris viridis]|uniref:ModE family transcriptional regulator n=1 Tax=Blastochloris viridis TaxID=1079 RepID=A0A0H5BJZ6_BLAVI|nr:TOBE domain-containing protein [Blastochloris viridis]ALK09266.1 Molybdenum-pterin-binding protein MopA [Blastochloris viridis]BAS00862.1 ModE family transcriptional regulator [Blastochloris viridis]CUU41929.1 Transcriptional regulator modE [Blastochloris viridis]